MAIQKILIVFGTRPEAIKLAPLIKLLKTNPKFNVKICVTAQHRHMLDQVLELFDIAPEYDLDIMRNGQDLNQITSRVLCELKPILTDFTPNILLVHGDTATTFAASLAAYYQQIPIAHVEAGLRTGNIDSPWPEEGYRKLTSSLAQYHFTPTQISAQNLINENINTKQIFTTGNTVIDALLLTQQKIGQNPQIQAQLSAEFNFLNPNKKLILVTAHRRESFGQGLKNICQALKNIATQHPNLQIIYPLHLNPNVRTPVTKALNKISNIFLIEPQQYLQFIYLMQRAHIILTDSGGLQEEAPSLNKPLLLMRSTSERPEAINAGAVKLVGTDTNLIVNSTTELLENTSLYQQMSNAPNPFGDGTASHQIMQHLEAINHDL